MADILERFDFDDKPGLDKLKNLGTAAEDVGKEFRNLGDEAEKAVKKTVEKSIDLDGVFGRISKTIGGVGKLAAGVAGAATLAFGAATAAGVKLASQNDRIAEQQEGLNKKWNELKETLAQKLAPAVYALQEVFSDLLGSATEGAKGLSNEFAINLGAAIIATGKTAKVFFNEIESRARIMGIQFVKLKLETEKLFTINPLKRIGINNTLKSLDASITLLSKNTSDLGDVYDEAFTVAKEKLLKLDFSIKRATKEEIEAIRKLREEYAKLTAQVNDRLEKARIDNAEGLAQIDLQEKAALRQIDLLEQKAKATAKAAGIEFDLDEEFRELRSQAEIKFENERLQLAADFNKKRLDQLRKDFKERFGVSLDGVAEFGKKADQALNQEVIRAAEVQARVIEARLNESLNRINPDGFAVFKKTLLDSLGLNEDEAGFLLQNIGNALNSVGELFTANIDRRIADNDRLLESIRTRTNEIENELQRELDLQEAGRENFVKSKREELAQLAKEEEAAEKEREKLEKKKRRAQVLADTIEQTSSLVTAAANTFKGFANIPIIGLALGIAAVAALFAAFNSAKAKASSAAKPQRLYKGGSLKGKVKKDSGYVNWLYPKSDVPGRGEGHRIADSDIVVGGREMVVAEGPANSQSDRFWDDMNSGKYNDVDIASSLDDHNTNQAKINQGFAERKATIVGIQRKEKASQALTEEATERIMNGVADKMIKYLKQRPQFIVTDKDTETITKWSEAKEDKQNLRAIS